MSLSWYRASLPNRLPNPALSTQLEADVVVVGAGLAGLSAALELAQRGYQVVVLEAADVGSGASAVNGGQVLTGLACDWADLTELVGSERCRQIWALSHEAVDLVRQRAASAADQCHWRSGALSVATSKAKAQKLQRSLLAMGSVLAPQCQWLDAAATREQVASSLYHGAISDPLSGHIHPLAYTRHVAQLAQSAGAQLYESSPVLRLEQSASGVSAHTAQGRVSARFGVIAANVNNERLEPQLRRRVLAVGTYLIATEPLPSQLALELMPQAPAVCDTNHVLDYFRLSHDQRLLFGGRVSYTGWASPGLYRRLQRRMVRVFPQLLWLVLLLLFLRLGLRLPARTRMPAILIFLLGFVLCRILRHPALFRSLAACVLGPACFLRRPWFLLCRADLVTLTVF